MKKDKVYRSTCPQYLGLEVFGDKWSLLIIRDMMLENKRYFREFLHSEEKIASNILSNRLNHLEAEGIISKGQDPKHKQKIVYSLTQKGVDLFPIVMEIARWSIRYQPVDALRKAKAQELLGDGTNPWQLLMNALTETHVGGGTAQSAD